MFSTDLHWDFHYSKINSKAYKILYLLRRTFTLPSGTARKCLYLMLVRSQLTYCSPLWRPYLIKHIIQLERIQHRATKFILNDYSSYYKFTLLHTQILYTIDAIFWDKLHSTLIRSLKSPSPAFNIYNYITFNTSSTWSGSNHKLIHKHSPSSLHHHFYFNRIVRLWNILQSIDLHLPLNIIKRTIYRYFWDQFETNFDCKNVHTLHLLCPCNVCSAIPRNSKFDNF